MSAPAAVAGRTPCADASDLGPRTLSVSLHDVAPATWCACERVLVALQEAAGARLPVALLVVPFYRGVDSALDRDFLRAIEARAATGDELVLHGYTHVDESPRPRAPIEVLRRRAYTAGEGEFSDLDREEALRRLHAGLDWFRARGWPVAGFVAPAWLMSDAARAALLETPLAYAAMRTELLLLARGIRLLAPSLVYSTRAAWRRALSPPVNHVLAARHAHRQHLRLALHPHDADHALVLRSWRQLLRRACADRRPCTEGELVAQFDRGTGRPSGSATAAPH